MKKVIIVVLNYNSYEDTIECVNSLLALNYSNYQIIIIDNNSTDNSVNKIKNFLKKNNLKYSFFLEKNLSFSNKKIVFIKAFENRGYSAGNNLGIRFAKLVNYDYIWILNNDTIVDKNSLKNFVECAENSNKRIGFFGNPIFYHKKNFLQGIGGKYNKFIAQSSNIAYKEKDLKEACKKINKVDYPIGASIFFKKDFIEEVGMLNETYFLFFEEMDLVIRAKNMGWDFEICCNSIIWHKESVSTNKFKTFVECIRLRNRIIFTKRYFPCYLLFVCISFIPVVFNRIKRGKLIELLNCFRNKS